MTSLGILERALHGWWCRSAEASSTSSPGMSTRCIPTVFFNAAYTGKSSSPQMATATSLFLITWVVFASSESIIMTVLYQNYNIRFVCYSEYVRARYRSLWAFESLVKVHSAGLSALNFCFCVAALAPALAAVLTLHCSCVFMFMSNVMHINICIIIALLLQN